MMEGIVLAVLALLSVPVLLIVILVKVCGLENKVADLTKKVGGIDLTRRNGAAENIASRDAPAPKASGWLSAQRELQSSRKGPRDAEAQRGLELGAKPPAPQTDLRVSASPRDASPAPSPTSASPRLRVRYQKKPTSRRRSTCSGCVSRTGLPFAATSHRRG